MIGRFDFLNRMLSPIISILRPVSPLAWLPIGLLVLQKAEPASIWVIFISSIWPMVLNTAAGVQRIPQDYMNVARVLNLSEFKVFTDPVPGCAALRVDGCGLDRRGLVGDRRRNVTGGVGIGFRVWDE
jgi:nitrate/nitrite transport system permease protein